MRVLCIICCKRSKKIVKKWLYVFAKIQKKYLRIKNKSCIITNVVTLIAEKREVAAGHAGVPWSECQVRKLATSHCTKKQPSVKNRDDVCEFFEEKDDDTHGRVYSHRLSY